MIIQSKIPEKANLIKNNFIPTIIVLSVVVIGTLGYYLMWVNIYDDALIDAFFMVIISITTVGFGQVHPLNNFEKIFTIFVILFGMGSLLNAISTLLENFLIIQNLQLRGRKKMIEQISLMENHFVIVGFGKVGVLAAYELKLRGEPFVVIDKVINPTNYFTSREFIAIEGDAREDETLLLANVEKARSLIVTTSSPEVTVFVIISARQLNPNMTIVARSDDDMISSKLLKAGANKVVNPYATGGFKMASLATNPSVVDFFDSSLRGSKNGFDFEMIELGEKNEIIGKTIRDLNLRKSTGVSIIGIVRDSQPHINPSPDFNFEPLDRVMLLGTLKELQEAERIINKKIY